MGGAADGLLHDRENGRGHGGEMITSVALHVCGGQVRMDRAACEQPLPGLQAVNRWKGTPFAAFGSFAGYCRGGAWGDTSHASAEQGALLMERGVEAGVRVPERGVRRIAAPPRRAAATYRFSSDGAPDGVPVVL